MEPRWTPAFPLERLPLGRAKISTHGATQVAVFRLSDGTLYAVDNRCPHEGYPLAQGSVSDCTLTCQWHNYKFDLRDGSCLMGEEGVRTYPVRAHDGMIEIDLATPDAMLAQLWADLDRAIGKHETGRAARNVVRLLDLGVDPVDVALATAMYDADHGEYGPSHAIAVCAELAVAPSPEPLLALAQAIDLAGRSTVRLPRRPVPPPARIEADARIEGTRLRALVEREEDSAAEALVRGAVAHGWRRAEIEPWFLQLCADHFLDFGHAAIYTSKVFAFLDRTAWRGAESLLGGLCHGIVSGTREDLLPAWAGFRTRMETLVPEAGSLVRDELVDADPREAFALVAATSDPIDALSIAAAERLLRFDVSIDADASVAEDWLDVTHRLTFVNALRALRRSLPAEADAHRPLALQAAHFVAMARPIDGPRRAIAPRPSSLDDVVRATAARDIDAAVDRAAGYLADGDARELVAALETLAMQDHATRAIYLAHHLKTLRAGAEEREATGDDRPLLGAVRFLASPLRERSVERLVRNAVALVREGKPPTKLT
jgi:nitrite reductase/ring-hydroxylating ferredoxin subunit